MRQKKGVIVSAIICLVTYYIFAVAGVFIFGNTFPDLFGNITKSMHTLLELMTLENWSMSISKPVMEIYPYAWLYFVPYVLITAFTIVNAIVGTIAYFSYKSEETTDSMKITESTFHLS